MLRNLVITAVIAIAFGLPVSAANAQQVPLVSFGTKSFGQSGNIIGSFAANGDIYTIDCDQAAGNCVDNANHQWDIGSPLNAMIDICSPDVTPASSPGVTDDCVHSVQITIVTKEPLVDNFVTLVRQGSEVNELNFDNNKLGRAFASGAGTTAGEEGAFQSVSYSLGMITPTKVHTLLITAPCREGVPPCDGHNYIEGIFVEGTSLSAN